MNTEEHLKIWEELDNIQFAKWSYSGMEWKKKLRNHIANQKYESVLDCGAGIYTEYFGFKDDNINIKYSAIEITDKYIQMGLDGGIDVVKAKIQDIPFEDDSFDVLLCNDVINHQKQIIPCIEEMYRVAKKEIIIAFHKPFAESCNPKDIKKAKKITELDMTMGYILKKDKCIDNFISFHSLKKYLIKSKFNFDFISFDFGSRKFFQHNEVQFSIDDYQILTKTILFIKKDKQKSQSNDLNQKRSPA